MPANDAKFKELVLYICHRSHADKRFGATKLNKLLFYADFIAYLKFGQPITGHPYRRLDKGPVPRRILPLLKEMQAKGDVAISTHDFHGKTQKRTLALRDADVSCFTAPEIALVTSLIDDFWGMNAKQMSEVSHQFRGWKLAADGEDIPYQVALVSLVQQGEEDELRTAELANELTSRLGDCRD